ncbi:MAG: cytochrome c oxidase subunit 3 [Gemmatimonadota bacterium]|jgi:heme/copper-type cytochrome/quinol oxidase subunit 3
MDATAQAAAHPPTATGLPTLKVGFWTFLGSETLFFGALISTFLVYKHGSVAGPYAQQVINIPLTSFSTFVLLMSSLCMVLALAAVQHDNRKGALLWLFMTALLGATFLGCQAYEFTAFYHEGLTLQSNLLGSTFFVLTGFHGAHVTMGVIWLMTLWFQTLSGRIGSGDALKVEVAGLYWHFVDIVWIVIFTVVYLLE